MDINITPRENLSFNFGNSSGIEYQPGEGIDITDNTISIDNTVATKEWVGDQGYLTEHQDISGKADITYVDQVDNAIIAALNTAKEEFTEELDTKASHTYVDYQLSHKQDTLTAGTNITIDANNVISGTPELFWCTYGTTTYGAIYTAINEGKLPVVEYKGSVYVYSRLSTGYTFVNTAGSDKLIKEISCTAPNYWSILNTHIQTDSDLFWCTYGVTTRGEIYSALAADKLPVCNYGVNTYVFCSTVNGSSAVFVAYFGDRMEILGITNNGWYHDSHMLQHDLEYLPTYSETGTQVLKNINGEIQWVNE